MATSSSLIRRTVLQRLSLAGMAAAGGISGTACGQQTGSRPSKKMRVLMLTPDGLNDKLVRRYLADMPNTRRIMAEGYSAQVLPFSSTWGNINFNSMVTGASPGIHYVEGNQCDVEALWDVLAESGRKSIMVNFPTPLPDASEHVGVVAAGGRDSGAQTTMFTGVVFQTRDITTGVYDHALMQRTGWPPGGGPKRGRSYKYIASPSAGGGRLETTLPLTASVEWRAVPEKSGGSYNRLALYKPGDSEATATVTTDQWTSWISGDVDGRGFHVRFRLLEMSADGTSLQLLASAGSPDTGFANDPALEQVLKNRVGPYAYRSAVPLSAEDPKWPIGIEEQLDAALWVADAAGAAFEDWDAEFFMYKGAIADSANHNCATMVDPTFHLYDPEAAPAYDKVLRAAYMATDKVIGRLLEIAEKLGDTHVVVAGDHGICVNNVVCDIDRRLQDAGLQTRLSDGQIDWQNTQAYTKRARQGNEIYINLKGREPQGIVSAADRPRVQKQILQSLLTWTDPGGGKRAVNFALRKEDAKSIGYWGPEAGDVIFAYNQGFTWGVNPDGSTTAMSRTVLANHGAGIPTQETPVSSNLGQLLAWGPKVRRGVQRDPEIQGPVKTSALGPTVAQLLGCRIPAQADAAIIRDMLV